MSSRTPKTRPFLSRTPLTPSKSLDNNIIENDDEAERRENRRFKLLELHQKNIQSPGTSSERRTSISSNIAGLTNAQLAEHHSNCIKLSAENKITMKNAFGLYLIDYMLEMVKRKEETNFQVASCSLDASAKIYAYRVDFVHAETYKMIGGLGRTETQSKKVSLDSEMNSEESSHSDGKRKKKRKGKTIEKNPKALNVSKFDLEFEVDPLFRKTSAAFDEGGTSGLLFNSLFCRDDSCEILLDSNSVISKSDNSKSLNNFSYTDISEIKDMYKHINWSSLQICPAFSDFEFTKWNNETDKFSDLLEKMSNSEKAFDIDKECEPIINDPVSNDTYFDYNDDNGIEDDDPGDDNIHDKESLLSQRISSVSSLKSILSEKPSDYSYFNPNNFFTWRGPHHWKILPNIKDKKISTNDKTNRKEKTKKTDFVLTYLDEEPSQKSFSDGGVSTVLSKVTLEKYNKSETTLPEDLNYDYHNLFKLFLRSLVLMTKKTVSKECVEEEIKNYDYSNSNDCQNYCPDTLCDGPEDDDEEELGNFVGCDDNTLNVFGQTLDATVLQQTLADGTLLAGDNLIQQPYKVAKININYAKTAKRIDVKVLKTCIWNILTKNGNAGKEESIKEEIQEEICFQKMYLELPKKVSTTMANNLSVPIVFVCLLHLANEKNLLISGQSTMDNIKISQI